MLEGICGGSSRLRKDGLFLCIWITDRHSDVRLKQHIMKQEWYPEIDVFYNIRRCDTVQHISTVYLIQNDISKMLIDSYISILHNNNHNHNTVRGSNRGC